MVMVKAFQIKPYQEHNQNETACMKYSEMIQLIKNIWIQISWYSLQQQKQQQKQQHISIRCKQTRNSGNCKIKRTC